MADCDVCGDGPGKYAYTCSHCGGQHCSDHRLPERHDCPGLADPGEDVAVADPDRSSARQRRETVEAGGVTSTVDDGGPDADRPWIRCALAAVLALLVAVGVVLVAGPV